jgi:hypothetical protein
MRVFIAASVLLALSACNWVVTKAPLFGATDQVGARHLRPGVWSSGSSSDCAFDERKPITEWPDCAGRGIISDGRWTTLDKKDGRWTRSVLRVLLTGGSPQILQTPPQRSSKGGEGSYAYYGLKAERLDRGGRITAFKMWPVLCSSPTTAPKTGDTTSAPATRPFPGMTMDASDSDCSTTSREALRQAADASQLWADTALTAHWVRDGDH